MRGFFHAPPGSGKGFFARRALIGFDLGDLGIALALVAHDAAIANLDDAVGIGGHIGIVRHQNDGVAVSMQLFEDVHHLLATGLVQRAGGLVGQNHIAAIHQRAGNRHPLLLPARELAGLVAQALFQAQPREQLARALVPLGRCNASVNGRDLGIAHGAQIAHEVVALEDEAEVLAPQTRQFVRRHLAGFFAADLVAAARGAIEAAQNIHQRGFARARRADDGHHFARVNIQIHIFQHRHHFVAGGVLAHHAAQAHQGLRWRRGGHYCCGRLHQNILAPRGMPLLWLALESPITTCSPSCRPSSTSACTRLFRPMRTWRSSMVCLPGSPLATRTV